VSGLLSWAQVFFSHEKSIEGAPPGGGFAVFHIFLFEIFDCQKNTWIHFYRVVDGWFFRGCAFLEEEVKSGLVSSLCVFS